MQQLPERWERTIVFSVSVRQRKAYLFVMLIALVMPIWRLCVTNLAADLTRIIASGCGISAIYPNPVQKIDRDSIDASFLQFLPRNAMLERELDSYRGSPCSGRQKGRGYGTVAGTGLLLSRVPNRG